MILYCAQQTQAHAADWAKRLTPPCVIFLHGELGSGKTTWARGFLRALGYQGAVKSPSYTLVELYQLPHCQVCHVDLYRINDPMELELIGLREYLDPRTLCLIEWPERAEAVLPAPDLSVRLSHHGAQRKASVHGPGAHTSG